MSLSHMRIKPETFYLLTSLALQIEPCNRIIVNQAIGLIKTARPKQTERNQG